MLSFSPTAWTSPLRQFRNFLAQADWASPLITLNETIHLPTNLMALAKPRSSLLRSGVTLHSAVWDAGYHGRSQALITVYNSYGFTVARNARVLQLVFVSLASATASAYAGRYQGENLSPA
jgi:dUTP pyrophosphatase